MDIGSKILAESLEICDYLDEKYPDPPLYPKDEKQKVADKELIAFFDSFSGVFLPAVFNKESKPLSEYMVNLKPYAEKLENELEKRGKFRTLKQINDSVNDK